MSIIFAGFAGSFASALRAPEEAYEGTVQYLQICASGIIFITAFNALGSIFRGIGDSKMPLLTVSIACIVNIFGDLLMVAVFKMGASGRCLCNDCCTGSECPAFFCNHFQKRAAFSFY